MFNTAILEVAFGLALLYFLFSLLCSSVVELISSIYVWRGQILRSAILEMLGHEELCDAVYKHPFIRSLHSRSRTKASRLPAYIPSRLFALTLIDCLVGVVKVDNSVGEVKGPRVRTQDGIRKALLAYINDNSYKEKIANALIVLYNDTSTVILNPDRLAEGEVKPNLPTDNTDPICRVEGWFQCVMDRATGAYKRRAMTATVIIATALTFVGNVDTLRFASLLWHDKIYQSLASTIVNVQKIKADSASNTSSKGAADSIATKEKAEILSAQDKLSLLLPIGWPNEEWTVKKLTVGKIAGLALTIIAVILGAPFWYTLLGKICDLRTSGIVPMPPTSTPSIGPPAPLSSSELPGNIPDKAPIIQ